MAGLDISQLGLPTAITDILNSANAYGRYKINVMMSESLSSREVEKTRQAMEDAVSQIENCTAEVKLYGMTDDLTSQLATGLSVKVYGKDPETLTTVSEKVMEIINDTEGFANADNGLGSGDATIILKVGPRQGARLRPDRCAGIPADRGKAHHHCHGPDPPSR